MYTAPEVITKTIKTPHKKKIWPWIVGGLVIVGGIALAAGGGGGSGEVAATTMMMVDLQAIMITMMDHLHLMG